MKGSQERRPERQKRKYTPAENLGYSAAVLLWGVLLDRFYPAYADLDAPWSLPFHVVGWVCYAFGLFAGLSGLGSLTGSFATPGSGAISAWDSSVPSQHSASTLSRGGPTPTARPVSCSAWRSCSSWFSPHSGWHSPLRAWWCPIRGLRPLPESAGRVNSAPRSSLERAQPPHAHAADEWSTC